MKLFEIAFSLLLWGRNRTRNIFENFFLTPIFILEHCEEICLFHNIISKHGDNFCVYILLINLQVLHMRLMNLVSLLSC